MLGTTRARLRGRRGRLAIVCAVALLAAAVGTAHTSVGSDHMSEAAAMCLAVLVGGAAVASLPAAAAAPPRLRAPLELRDSGIATRVAHAVPHLPRGDPALLQVFRR
jgi:hypothetical protein